jgi:ankyrin repeat protein
MENALTSEGYNAIIYAAVVKNFEAVNYLSIAGFNINSCDYDGRSLLLHCLMHEQYFLADRLIERGANINL